MIVKKIKILIEVVMNDDQDNDLDNNFDVGILYFYF